MTAEKSLIELLRACRTRTEAERREYLDDRCRGNPELRARVERVLAREHEAENFVQSLSRRAGYDDSNHLKTLELLRSGDREDFDRVFRIHATRVLVYANYNIGERLRGKLDPADVLERVYLKAFKSREAFRKRAERHGLTKLLIRLADQEITEAYRDLFKAAKLDSRSELKMDCLQSRGEGAFDPLEWTPADQTSISAKIVRQAEYQRVMDTLRRLTPVEQYVTVARIIEALPTARIAARLGRPNGAVRRILTRVRARLRDMSGNSPE